jgi:hypothetical protein
VEKKKGRIRICWSRRAAVHILICL